MSNVLIEVVATSAGPAARERLNCNSPAVENEATRSAQLGPFRQDNTPASQAATLLTMGGVDAVAPTSIVAGFPGTIVGIVARANADLTAGTATFRPAKNGTSTGAGAATDSAILSDLVQASVVRFAPADQVAFVAGDLLGVTLTTNGAYAPVTADNNAYLLVRWSAI